MSLAFSLGNSEAENGPAIDIDMDINIDNSDTVTLANRSQGAGSVLIAESISPSRGGEPSKGMASRRSRLDLPAAEA